MATPYIGYFDVVVAGGGASISVQQQENPMIKVSVMYPYAAGARFDHTYYRERHMPMMKQRLGAACLYYTVENGIAGGTPGTNPVYVAKCDFVCTSVEAFQAARGPHVQEIRDDIANYTDIQPVLQISEVVVERSEV
jgi:uncharacterized protein (TIGR02118 family)